MGGRHGTKRVSLCWLEEGSSAACPAVLLVCASVVLGCGGSDGPALLGPAWSWSRACMAHAAAESSAIKQSKRNSCNRACSAWQHESMQKSVQESMRVGNRIANDSGELTPGPAVTSTTTFCASRAHVLYH